MKDKLVFKCVRLPESLIKDIEDLAVLEERVFSSMARRALKRGVQEIKNDKK